MILAFIILSVTLLDTQAKLMTLSQSQALSTQISALDSLGAYSVIQLAIAGGHRQRQTGRPLCGSDPGG